MKYIKIHYTQQNTSLMPQSDNLTFISSYQ